MPAQWGHLLTGSSIIMYITCSPFDYDYRLTGVDGRKVLCTPLPSLFSFPLNGFPGKPPHHFNTRCVSSPLAVPAQLFKLRVYIRFCRFDTLYLCLPVYVSVGHSRMVGLLSSSSSPHERTHSPGRW